MFWIVLFWISYTCIITLYKNELQNAYNMWFLCCLFFMILNSSIYYFGLSKSHFGIHIWISNFHLVYSYFTFGIDLGISFGVFSCHLVWVLWSVHLVKPIGGAHLVIDLNLYLMESMFFMPIFWYLYMYLT